MRPHLDCKLPAFISMFSDMKSWSNPYLAYNLKRSHHNEMQTIMSSTIIGGGMKKENGAS